MKCSYLMIALALCACGDYPTPPAVEVNAATAMVVVLDSWRVTPTEALPRVFIVEDDGCAGLGWVGFVNPWTGMCVGGFIRDKKEIYLVRPSSGFYSSSNGLAHELGHFLGWQHYPADDWAPESKEGRRILVGSDALRKNPQVDEIPK